MERVRFTSAQPTGLHRHVIDDMAQTRNVMPSCTCRCSRARDRIPEGNAPGAYRRDRYLAILDRRPGDPRTAAITTTSSSLHRRDRGEFAGTHWPLVSQARFAGAFTFRYCIRPGTRRPPWTTGGARRGAAGALRAAPRAGRGEHLRGEQKLAGDAFEVLVARARAARTAATTGVRPTPGDKHASCNHPGQDSAAQHGATLVTVTGTRGRPALTGLSDAAPMCQRPAATRPGRRTPGEAAAAAHLPRLGAPARRPPPE